MRKFLGTILLFLVAALCAQILVPDYWDSHYIVRFILGFPYLFMVVDLMRLTELICMFVFKRKMQMYGQ